MALVDLVQKSKNQSSLSNHRGQALVEYVLMLVVSVSLLLALIYQVFTPFQSFLKGYMGDYIQCLLETGELPALGSPDGESVLKDEGCNSRFEAATLANGRPPLSTSNSTANNQSQNQNSSKSNSNSSSSSTEGASGSASSSSGGNNLLISSMKKKTGTEVGGVSQEKTTEIPLSEDSKFYNRIGSYSPDPAVRPAKSTYVGIAGMTEDEKKKQERKENNKRTVANANAGELNLKKIPVKKPAPKPVVEAEDEPMTFGNFFRFLLIAAIVIALLVVLGSQALKISKSQEK